MPGTRRVDREFGMEVLTSAEMERADRLTVTAGMRLVRAHAQRRTGGCRGGDGIWSQEGPILVVAGGGNNGGDGFVAAAELRRAAARCRSSCCASGIVCMPMWARRRRGGKSGTAVQSAGHRQAALTIDALFGAGLNRPVEGAPFEMIEAINADGAPVLSVDLPSGINGTTAAVMGIAIDATQTVTFFRRSRPSCSGPDALRSPGTCGRYRDRPQRARRDSAADLRERSAGLAPAVSGPRIDGHKYARGHAVICQGISLRPAPRGCRRGVSARRRRAGHAGLAPRCPGGQRRGADRRHDWAVDTAAEFAELLTDTRLNALVIGPGAGVGDRTRDFVLSALSARRSLVLDADALTSFAAAPITC